MLSELLEAPPAEETIAGRILSLASVPILSKLWAWATLAGFAAAVGALRGWLASSGSRLYTHDGFFLLDGAWRLMSGQRPHVDFLSPFGFLEYLPIVLGLKITPAGGKALAYAQVLVTAALTLWAVLITRKRMLDIPRVLLIVSVVWLASAPFALGTPPAMLGPSTVYNRYGYAILAIGAVEALFAPRGERTGSEFAGGASTGILAALMLFSKYTYCGILGLLVLGLIPARKQTFARWAGMAAGFAAVSLACVSYLGFDLRPMWNDVRQTAASKHIKYWWYFDDMVLVAAAQLAALGAGTAAVLAIRGARREARKFVLAGACVAGAGCLAIFTNFEQTGFPLMPLFAVFCIQAVCVSREPVPERATPLAAGLIVWCGVLIAGAWASSAMGYAFGSVEKLRADSLGRLTFSAPALAGFELLGAEAGGYGAFVNDGLELVRANRRAGETVMSLDFSNPFSFGLGLKPARGGATVVQFKSSFDDVHKPSGEWLFGLADVVMLPKQFSDGGSELSIPRIYGPYLESHFRPAAESERWILYRRASIPAYREE